MDAESVQGRWWRYPIGAHASPGNVTGAPSFTPEHTLQGGLRLLAEFIRQRRLAHKLIGGLLFAAAILAVTYATAAILVRGTESHSQLRAHRALAMQQAAIDYRRARAECQRAPESRRDACVAAAHAEESRARAEASLAPRTYLAALRIQADAAHDAARDTIVVEPACNVVARGQASVCEIQVSVGAAKAPGKAATAHSTYPVGVIGKADANRSLARLHADTQTDKNRASFQIRARNEAGNDDAYFSNVAATVQ